jgi:hypothetical protein
MPIVQPPRNPFDLRAWLNTLTNFVNDLETNGGGGAEEFLDLTDTPSDYTGASGQVVVVNNTEDGLEFAAASGLGDMLIATYDPQGVSGDAFDTDNHTDGTTNKVFTATEKTKLSGIATGAEVNVNADWNAVSGDAQILNKPTIVNNATHTGDATGSGALTVVALRGTPLDSTVGSPTDGKILVYRTAGSDWILEDKPATSGSPDWGDIAGTLSDQTDLQLALDAKVDGVSGTGLVSVDNTDPNNPIISTTAEANVNADWDAVSGDAQILNKPTIINVSDDAYDATTWNGNTDAPTKNAIRDKIETMSGGGGTWGSITGTLSDQTDLDAALDSKLESVVAGTNVTVDNTDPLNPIINASVGGGGDYLLEDALNNSTSEIIRFTKNTTGTPADGIGLKIQAAVETSTTEDTEIGSLNYFWLVSNHASRVGCLDINVNNSGGTRRVARFIPEGSNGSLLLGTESTDAKLGVFRDGDSVIAGFDSNTTNGRAFIRISRFGNPYMYAGVAGASYTTTAGIAAGDAFIETVSTGSLALTGSNKIKFLTAGVERGSVNVDGVRSEAAFYLGDPAVDGTWRIIKDGNNLAFERRESSVWVAKETMLA